MIALVGAMFVAMGSVSAAPGIAIEFSDRDGIVTDGTKVRVYVRDASTGTSTLPDDYAVQEVTVSGELVGTEVPKVEPEHDGAHLSKTDEQGDGNYALEIDVPKGTPHGGYTVAVVFDDEDVSTTAPLTASKILTVGDAGSGVGSVEIAFNKFHLDDDNNAAKTCGAGVTDDEKATTKTDDANAPMDESICLTATVKNSLGNTTDDDDVQLLFITSEGGTWIGAGLDAATTVSAVPAANRGAVYHFSVTAGKAAKVTVEVDAGPAEGSIELTFTGGAASLAIGDASDVLARSGDAYTMAKPGNDGNDDGDFTDDGDTAPVPAVEGGIIFEVTASDKAGNSVDLAPGAVTAVKITDSDGKDVTSSFNTDNEMQKAGSSQVVQVRVGTKSTKVAAGEYTAEVSLTEVNDSKVSAMFSVADVADDVSLSASAMTSEMIGDVITVTATVTDANGNPVADGTDVDFDVSSSTGLAGIGKGHGANDTVDTVGGMASVKYAVVGHGTSVVSATAGGATGVVVIESTAGMVEPEAMPEEEASVGCLSNLSGFSTWSCGVESSASEIFGLVSARGVTAIHLHNGTAWVRYSVVDGAMVPGSSDFMVTENDILYISN